MVRLGPAVRFFFFFLTDVGSILGFSGTSALSILEMKMTAIKHTFLMKLFLKTRQNELLVYPKGKADGF